MKPAKKPNPYVKRGLVQARVNVEEMRTVIEKAFMYSRGNISEYVRTAVLNYRPTKKVAK